MVEVAELFVAQGGRAALVAGGMDVAALGACLGDGDLIGCLLHGGVPPWVFLDQNLGMKAVRSGSSCDGNESQRSQSGQENARLNAKAQRGCAGPVGFAYSLMVPS
jgi:hypothetical protein